MHRLRAGHADRERAIDVLKAAFAEGRLDQDEYTERVGRVQTASTFGELAALTADLPVGPLGSLVPVTMPTGPAPPSRLELPAGEPMPPVAVTPPGPANGLAFVSVFLGVIAVLFSVGVFAAVPAMVSGWIALVGPNRRGKGLATVGILLALVAFWRAVNGG